MFYSVSKHVSVTRCKSGECDGLVDFRRPRGAKTPVRETKCPKCGWEHWKQKCKSDWAAKMERLYMARMGKSEAEIRAFLAAEGY
jgi:hypothetical protein